MVPNGTCGKFELYLKPLRFQRISVLLFLAARGGAGLCRRPVGLAASRSAEEAQGEYENCNRAKFSAPFAFVSALISLPRRTSEARKP